MIDGTWHIIVNSPMGAQKAVLDLKSDGATLTGTQTAQGKSQALAGGTVNGNAFGWSAQISSPMPMILQFSGTVEGDAIQGSVKAGAFGSFPFSGSRAA